MFSSVCQCSNNSKGSLWVALYYGWPPYNLYVYILIHIFRLFQKKRYYFIIQLLHMDAWSSRQSEISLHRKYLFNWAKAYSWLNRNGGRCEMIYADTHVRYGLFWVSLRLGPEKIQSITVRASKWLGISLGQQPTEWLRSYESIWQSVFVFLPLCLHLSLSHHRNFDPFWKFTREG